MQLRGKGELFLKILLPALLALLYFTVPAIQEFIENGIGFIERRDFTGLRSFILQYGSWAPLTAILMMVLQSVIPFVPGLALTMTNAWIFGWQYGTCYSWIGALGGAWLDFAIARYYGRPMVEHIIGPGNIGFAKQFFLKYGLLAVLFTRLTPIIPFKVVSYGAGLTRVTLWQYLVATGLGQTPAIVMYSFLGQNITGSAIFTVTITVLLAAAGALFYRRLLIQGRKDEK